MQSLLVVEDSMEDFNVLLRAFRKSTMKDKIVHCEDGDDALSFLFEIEKNRVEELPLFILLDLNLPGTTGKQVLEIIKKHALLKRIPVIVFTTSSNDKDVNECYSLGANAYMVKPMGYHDLEKKIYILEQFWINASVLPKYIG